MSGCHSGKILDYDWGSTSRVAFLDLGSPYIWHVSPLDVLGHCLLVVGSGSWFLTIGIVSCRPNSAHCSKMLAKRDITSSRAVGQDEKGSWTGVISRRPSSGKPVEPLNEREFHERFFIPNGVSVQLVDGDPTSAEKAAHGATFFSNEQFNVELHFSLLSLFK